MKILIAGGGTGGHIYPALAIADAIRDTHPEAEVLFIGARGRMEMEKVPLAGYPIEGLDIAGIQRRLTWKNLLIPFKLASSLWKSFRIIIRFKPDVAIGVGGYASGPALRMASWLGVPVVLQEQNSYAGMTNRLLAQSAALICVAWPGMDRYFPGGNIVLTGNPLRAQFSRHDLTAQDARQQLGMDPDLRTILIMGGSLGARALNEAVQGGVAWLKDHPDHQLLWQCGNDHLHACQESEVASLPQVHLRPYLDQMDLAYAAADIIVARAGALTISELCLVGKPAILVPSPYVAEDHQTKNAQALAHAGAAVVIENDRVGTRLFSEIERLASDVVLRKSMASHMSEQARPGASKDIARRIVQLIKPKEA
ncbi:MAG: undecaprenyldiphospho-muramoylpentapeptide beta-N-acetylglucosaminyltransferase [Saprospiraceae bacterium]|nr:undecaprenyldiphospho-muramoylpentapeptide beta-N-acetylglucosaminyltransferase [Saprospiraceae bacterium]